MQISFSVPKTEQAEDVKEKSRSWLRLAVGLERKHLFAVLVFVDGLADAILLPVQAILLGLGEMAIVLSHVCFLAILKIVLALFDIGRLLRVQGAILQAVSDAILLVLLALIDFIDARMTGIDNSRAGARSVGLSGGGCGGHQASHCQD
jgi:hypothetical protein